jgi:accessory gene regulator B
MISFFSEKITNLLCDKKIIEHSQKDIYKYGYEIFISTFISFLIVFTIGILTNRILESGVFYVVFCSYSAILRRVSRRQLFEV